VCDRPRVWHSDVIMASRLLPVSTARSLRSLWVGSRAVILQPLPPLGCSTRIRDHK
jgi:hypothetical protein